MEMKTYLCDAMCIELGRWLRIAGYDTAIAENSLQDRTIFEQAVREERRLLTKDKHFIAMDPEKRMVIFLKGQSLDEWAEQLKEEEGVDWLYHPLTRCLHCNSVLKKIIPAADQLVKYVDAYWSCPTCHQLFWRGSHTDQMMSRLNKWQKIG